MDFTPLFRTPVMDLTGCLINFQHGHQCADFELRFAECMEAYGIPNGYKKCSDIFEDFRECTLSAKQQERVLLMRQERQRQFKAGLRTKAFSDPPRDDSY